MADNQYDEKNKHTKRNVYSVLLGIFCWWLGSILVFPLMYVISGYPLSEVARFFKGGFDLTQPVFLLRVYVNWFAYLSNSSAPSSLALYLPFLPFIALFSIAIIGILTNPYGQLSTVFGNGRLATYEDIKKMNLFNGFCIVLGRFKGKLMKLNETLSVLALAPPGAGKTAGVVVPTIFESDTMSIIVNDVKPELAEKTSGARASPRKWGLFLSSIGGRRTIPKKAFIILRGILCRRTCCLHWGLRGICILILWWLFWWKNPKAAKIPTGLKRGVMR